MPFFTIRMNKNKLNSHIVILIILIMAIFAASYFIYKTISIKGQHVADLLNEDTQKSSQEREIKNLANSLSTLKEQSQEIDAHLVSSDGEVNFINTLENAAKNQNLEALTSQVSIDSPKSLKLKALEYLVLKIEVNGDWNGIYKFMSIFPNLPYKINIDQAEISLSDKGVWHGSFNIRALKKISN